MDNSMHIALVGNPNCGKTAIFNAMTGSKQRVANYSGVTVEKKHGYFVTANNTKCTLIDLPGTYSLRSRSPDEKLTYDVVMDNYPDEQKIDLILCVIDATNLTSGLRLILELKQTGKPIIVAFNMFDLANRRGYKYDLNKLQQLIGCQIIPTVAIKSSGIDKLVSVIENQIPNLQHSQNNWQIPSNEDNRAYHKQINKIIAEVKLTDGSPSTVSSFIDKILLHPVIGILVLLLVLFLVFQSVFSLALIPQNMLQNLVNNLQNFVLLQYPNSLLGSLLGNGIIAGVGAVLVFLPQIILIALFVVLLEDSGYMARAAFIMDKIMGSAGLHGKAFIPLLSSFACAIPGIIAARTIENRNDRIITILISPLMTCSARLPIYTLLIGALIPNKTLLGFINLQGLIMFSLYFSGIVFGLLVAAVMRIFFFSKNRQPSIIELPSYKMPMLRNVFFELVRPVKMFLKRAGTIIVAIMIILWGLSSFPFPPANASQPAITYSLVGILGHHLQPLFAPIGFNWQIVAALIPGIAAREVVVSGLGTIYALSGNDDVVASGLGHVIAHSWSLATGLALLVWYVFAPQCASTLAIVKRETNSWKYVFILFFYQFMLAYSSAYIVYHLALILL
jgi:ferrous iron transport protein B